MLHYKYSHATGYTLLELMFSLMLAMLVISFIIQTYLQHIQEWSMLRGHLEIERKNERMIAALREQIYLSGNLGCARLSKDFPILSYKDETYSAENKLIVTRLNHLIVRGVNDVSMLIRPVDAGRVTLIVSNKNHWKPKQRMVISDCEHGEIIEIKSIRRFTDYSLMELSDPLQSFYKSGASIGVLNKNELYLNHQILTIKERNGVAREIISGLNKLSFYLSERNFDKHLQRLPGEVHRWSNVEGVLTNFQLTNATSSRDSHVFTALVNNNETQ